LPRAARLLVPGAIALAAFALACFELRDDDVGFHVASGRLVRAALNDGEPIPTSNPFSYADRDAPWTQHQWLSAAAIAWLVDDAPVAMGLRPPQGAPDARVLVTLKAMLVALLFGGISAWLVHGGVAATNVFAISALALAAAAFRLYERPYLVSALCLAAVVAMLEHTRQTASQWALGVAAALTVANAHLHAGVIDVLLVWLACTAGALVDVRRDTHRIVAQPRLFLAASSALAVLLVASMAALAPSGLDAVMLPLSFSSNAYWHAHLKEFRPLWDAALPLWPALVWIAALAVAVALSARALPSADLLLATGFGLLALRHQRMVLPLVIATLPVMARATSPLLVRVPRRTSLSVALGLTLLAAAFSAQSERFHLGLGRDGIDARAHPFALLDRLDAEALPAEVFVSDSFAGTFLWRFTTPQGVARRVLVHNALEAYHESTFRDVYQPIRYARPGFEDALRTLGVGTFLLKHTSAGERRQAAGEPNVRDVLWSRSGTGVVPDAVLVDFDDAGALWVLRDALPPGVETLDGFPVNPDTGIPRPGAGREQIEAALAAHARAHPGSERSAQMLARIGRR